MTTDVLNLIIARVSLVGGKLDEETSAQILERSKEAPGTDLM
jgi:hypothetical protein